MSWTSKGLTLLLTLVVAVGIVGCDGTGSGSEDDGEVKFVFRNESSQVVTLRTTGFNPEGIKFSPVDVVSEFLLQPGEVKKLDEYSTYTDTLYYDWDPKSTVDANQVSKRKVIFVDKPSL